MAASDEEAALQSSSPPRYGATPTPPVVPPLALPGLAPPIPSPREGSTASKSSARRSYKFGRLSTRRHSVEDPDLHEFEEIEGTAYTGAMATIIKDVQHLLKERGSSIPCRRVSRIIFAVGVLLTLVVIQFYVLVTIKTFVTSPAVRSIRQIYDKYERTMYHGHVKDSGWGFALGIGGKDGPFFDPAMFDTLDNKFKGSLCLIPFSQPAYLSLILFIWSLSVIGELKACYSLFRWLQVIPSDDVNKTMRRHESGHMEKLEVVVSLPNWFKCALLSGVIFPRCLASCVLCWLGCRWLCATLDLTEVLINVVALEFVISLNSVLYSQLVSSRSKKDHEKMRLHVRGDKETYAKGPTLLNFVGSTLFWGMLSALWIYFYMCHLQKVLPGYQWDVRGPCRPWVAKRFNFWRI